ncbi:LOW QUALITY PROTEIN: uncharacterized protein LOC128922007 [Zeugodacus cucurbitae]|uniref:LOW QUALITY PROTEIN: uncharacterized protein LOC128922007 n=1 Tax=Zeugodacus cucurbitae TaxID=28588 RepID=UPI0023D94702|nr:LOW QUALITY PROTEIN: uncharacterized protein LOC128922007 [Zeugodacus cucurbitae]
MASILDLPDDCLTMICKKLERDVQQYCWSNVCKRFQNIYFEYFHNWMEVNDNLAKNYGHLIGTGDFPLRTIKKLNLSKSKCTKYFLNKLRDCHKEIEEAKLFSFTDEYLAELLPLPNLKKLICIGTYNLRGSSLMELNSLTELHINTNKLFQPESLLQITYYNPLRTLVMPNDPHMFSNRYAFEMFENLKNVEQLVIEFNPCKSWQLVGTLPKLKRLEIWDFVSHECETCLEDHNLYETCTGQHATIFFDELRRRNQLEELVLSDGYVSEQHLLKISELTNLKRLIFLRAALTPSLSLGVFKELVNLEELHLDGCRLINAEASLELIRCCKKLKVLLLWFVGGVTSYFLTEANDILSRRQPAPLEPLTIGFSQIVEYLKFEKPLPFLRFVRLTRRFVGAEEDYLKREEDYVSQTNAQGDSLKRKFSILNRQTVQQELQITAKSA